MYAIYKYIHNWFDEFEGAISIFAQVVDDQKLAA